MTETKGEVLSAPGGTSPGSSAPMPAIRPRRESNRLYRENLAKGQTGLSIAFDLPTQTGLDSDHPLARGEVGKVGVAISHIGDMRSLFEDIPLASMNTSMTINATAPWLMALYIAIADEQGAPRALLQGTTQNDIIKEYLSRGSYVFPPGPVAAPNQGPDSLLRARDAEMESDERLLLSLAGSRRDAGAGAQLRAGDRHRGARSRAPVGEVDEAGFAEVVGRMSFFVNAGMRFVTELAKMRAFAELWDEITRDRYGVADPAKRRFRYGVQVNSLGLTEQQPENNAYRILIEMLSVVLSRDARARAVQLPAWNEALGLPRPFDQQWSLRLQQIMAYETDLLEFGDIFDGSTVMASARGGAQARGARRDRRDRRHGRRGSRRSNRAYMKSKAGRIQHPPPRGDRARRTDRRRRQRVHESRAFAADRRREFDHGPVAPRRRRNRSRGSRRGAPRRDQGAGPASARRRCARRRRAAPTSCLPRSRRPRRARPPANGAMRCSARIRRIPRADRRLADGARQEAAGLDDAARRKSSESRSSSARG